MNRNFAFSICIIACLVFAAFADPPAGKGYVLTWSDEFDGVALDTNTWTMDTCCSGGAQYQTFTDHNVTIENGAAVLWAKHEKHGYYDYTSSWIETIGKREFKYGYFEVRLKAMYGNGPWAAFWMMGSDFHRVSWPACGEIELYDQRTGTRNNTYPGDSAFKVSCDFASASGGPLYNTAQYLYTDCLCSDYHMYAIEWDSTAIKYFFDGNKIWEYDSINESYNFSSFHQPFFFNVQVTLNPPLDTSIFPQKMYIDYVRVYQKSTQVKASPQKSTSKIFTLSNPSQARLKVYDLQGRLIADYTDRVRHLKSGENVMKGIASDLPIGIYVTRLFDGVKTVSEKLVVQK